MKGRVFSLVILWLLVDLYFFSVVKLLTNNMTIYAVYWMVDILLVCLVIYSLIIGKTKFVFSLMPVALLLFIPKLVASVLLLLEDITRLFRHFPSRNLFVSELVVLIAFVFFLIVLFGITKGRHYYKVRRELLYFENLPDTFDGFTITQLSDIHAGSFSDDKGVQKGLDLVNAQKSDMILFTGDLVNNKASEMDQWISGFAGLTAPLGKYSVLGNHDYGDYIRWDSADAKRLNLIRLKNVHAEIGFHLLLNESVTLNKDGHTIALVGVENWGKGGFHKYGDLKLATANVNDGVFTILMSHDPSHWDAVTLKNNRHIDLTLSGHTHGAQFGFEVFGFKWSPIKYVYKQWAGMYKKRQPIFIRKQRIWFSRIEGSCWHMARDCRYNLKKESWIIKY